MAKLRSGRRRKDDCWPLVLPPAWRRARRRGGQQPGDTDAVEDVGTETAAGAMRRFHRGQRRGAEDLGAADRAVAEVEARVAELIGDARDFATGWIHRPREGPLGDHPRCAVGIIRLRRMADNEGLRHDLGKKKVCSSPSGVSTNSFSWPLRTAGRSRPR